MLISTLSVTAIESTSAGQWMVENTRESLEEMDCWKALGKSGPYQKEGTLGSGMLGEGTPGSRLQIMSGEMEMKGLVGPWVFTKRQSLQRMEVGQEEGQLGVGFYSTKILMKDRKE